jgi:hydroxyethylthiazole kinase-like uncharacterized protein yjeF
MKLLSKEQVYEADRITAERQEISSTDLMERAGLELFNWIHTRMQGAQVPIHVFCGIGNNGGDGMVLSRHLLQHGYQVMTYIVNYSDKRSKDFLINYDRLKETTKEWPAILKSGFQMPEIQETDIIVDAIFGIGLNRPPEAWVVQLFRQMELSKAFTLSVDIPSGLYADRPILDASHVLQSNYILSFQTPKLVFFLKETAQLIRQWEVLDIGIDAQYLSEVETNFELIGKNEIIVRYKPREPYAHKGDFGHALMIGGSFGKIGAISLASKACLMSGAGLVTCHVPQCGYEILQIALPEAMVMTDVDPHHISALDLSQAFDVMGIGPGMGTLEKTATALQGLFKSVQSRYILDADAINILAKYPDLLQLLPQETVITPHLGELRRLIGDWSDDFDMLKKVSTFSRKHQLIVVVKGAHTIIVDSDKHYINTTGNPGMATAGSGDVLTGIITGLIAQKYSPLDAAIMGVYLHGKSGDIAVEKTSYQSLIASHLIDHLGAAYISLFEEEAPPPNEEAES